MKRSGAVLLGLVLCGCPAPRFVSGVVYGRAADDRGVHALATPIEGATVTWSCPADVAGAPPPQTLKTDFDGRFKSKEYSQQFEIPGSCELVVEKDGYAPSRIRFEKLYDPARTDSRHVVRAAVELRKATPDPASATTSATCVDLPMAARGQDFTMDVLRIDVKPSGFFVDGVSVDEQGLFTAAKKKRAAAPEVRALIVSEKNVEYGRVVHAMDLVKQAGIAKLAFGVGVAAPPPAPPHAP